MTANGPSGARLIWTYERTKKMHNGNVSGIIGLINDVTEQQLLKMELEERSKLDRLTGLYNKATS